MEQRQSLTCPVAHHHDLTDATGRMSSRLTPLGDRTLSVTCASDAAPELSNRLKSGRELLPNVLLLIAVRAKPTGTDAVRLTTVVTEPMAIGGNHNRPLSLTTVW